MIIKHYVLIALGLIHSASQPKVYFGNKAISVTRPGFWLTNLGARQCVNSCKSGSNGNNYSSTTNKCSALL